MNTKSPIIYFALMEESPLTRLGIEQFVLALRPTTSCVLQTDSVAQMCQEIPHHSLNLLISELTGAQESAQLGGEGLMKLGFFQPALRQIIYTYSHCGEILHALNRFPQVSLISRQETPEQTRSDFLQALSGTKVCSPRVQLIIADHVRETTLVTQHLTSCENVVLDYLFHGLSLSEIARKLHRSIKTISAHKRNAMQKLAVKDDVGLYALRQYFFNSGKTFFDFLP